VQVDELFEDCLDEEDDEGDINYIRKLLFPFSALVFRFQICKKNIPKN
jgi:hypothetical protein